jgi:cytoskeletal protein CcmA (bactofilin family)
MFRSKKSPNELPDAAVEPQPPIESTEAVDIELPKTALRRPTVPQPARPLPATNFPFDMPRRGADLAPVANRVEAVLASQTAAVREKQMQIGRGVRLKGEIADCDKLVIEGEVEITAKNCRAIHIGAGGSFKGTFDVAEADISGDFEGDLIARDRLIVRPSGRAKGRLRYRHIIIEAGGVVTGEVSALDGDGAAPVAAAEPAGDGS